MTNNYALLSAMRDWLLMLQNIRYGKTWVIELQPNGRPYPSGDSMAHVFFDCWKCFFSKPRCRKNPQLKFAEKRPGCGPGPSRQKWTNRVLKAIIFSLPLNGRWRRGSDEKHSLPCNITGSTYGLRLCRIASSYYNLPKGRGWLNTGDSSVFKEKS